MEYTTLYLKENPCYTNPKTMIPKGIIVHSTGVKNTSLARYISPDDGMLGPNKFDNHWNKQSANKCVHAFIGHDKNGVVKCYHTLPFRLKAWGCGRGEIGSYNGTCIQFEICENRDDDQYAHEAFGLAANLCAHLCKRFDIDVNNIVSHWEAHKRGFASAHHDPDHWLEQLGLSMDLFRTAVSSLIICM